MFCNKASIKNLRQIPGVGVSIAQDLINLGIYEVNDLVGRNPEKLFNDSNQLVGQVQDRCLLYVFRCAVYFAETLNSQREPEMLKWWNWKNKIHANELQNNIL